jgi:type II secretory pathway component PulK
MTSRDGFALLAVLWVVAALTAIVGLGLGALRIDARGSVNRLELTRGRWAAEACLAIAEARWAGHRFTDTATVDLGRETRCAWRADDPTARVNGNAATPTLLYAVARQVGCSPQVVDTLLAHRPYEDTAQVRASLTPDGCLLPFLTVDGPGSINLNDAPPAIVLSIPGLGTEVVAQLREHARLRSPIVSLDQLANLVPGTRTELLAHYADLAAIVTFAPSQLLITSRGWVGEGGPEGLHSTIEILSVPLPDRLAVIRRRMW